MKSSSSVGGNDYKTMVNENFIQCKDTKISIECWKKKACMILSLESCFICRLF